MSHKQLHQHKRQWRTAGQKQLWGKVVLLIGNDTAVLQKLVRQLAQKGADIALLCWQMPLDMARKIKESVHSMDRNLLLIEQVDEKYSTHSQLIEMIATELGRLDVFIDLSAQKQEPKPNGNGNLTGFSQPNWPLTQAVLQEMARS